MMGAQEVALSICQSRIELPVKKKGERGRVVIAKLAVMQGCRHDIKKGVKSDAKQTPDWRLPQSAPAPKKNPKLIRN